MSFSTSLLLIKLFLSNYLPRHHQHHHRMEGEWVEVHTEAATAAAILSLR